MTVAAPHHLPVPVSSFIGREQERAELVELVARARLVTLVGPPGVGKTRLAIEVAGEAGGVVPDGAYWVDLATVDDPEAVVPALARALGVQQQRGPRPLDTIVAALADRRLLVVLDNCEHLVAGVATVVQVLLERAAGVTVLATSRQALEIVGERPWPVDTLAVPPPGATPEQVLGSHAGELFCTRAATVTPRFVLDAPTAPVIADICRRLDGIPLAIELAAARTTVLSLEQIAAGLDDRFRLLGRAQRGVDGRHQTLAAALEWSYELLTPPERALLRRLGVFVGEFDLPAIQAACVGVEVTEANVLDLASSLVAKSLVVARTEVNPARYRLLETVREFAGDRLGASGEGPPVATRWAEWYLNVVHHAEAELTGVDQASWLATLDVHYPNIWATLRWAQACGGRGALILASQLPHYWRMRGLSSEGRDFLEAALASCPDADPDLRAKGMWGAGFLALMMGDTAKAESQLLESAAVYRTLGDAQGEGRALLLIGNARRDSLGANAAIGALESSISLARSAGDSWCLAHALCLLGRSRLDLGDPKSARSAVASALEVATETQDLQGKRLALMLLGELDMLQGSYREARSRLEAALVLTRQLGEPYGSGAALEALGQLAAREYDYPGTWSYLADAVRVDQAEGSRQRVPGHLSALGRAELDQGRPEMAAPLFEHAMRYLPGHIPADAIVGLGQVRLAQGRLDDARSLFADLDAVGSAAADWHSRANVLAGLAAMDRADGRLASATDRLCTALDLRVAIGDRAAVVETLEAIGGVEVQAGDPERATRLLAAAEAALTAGDFRRSPRRIDAYDADVATTRDQLSSEVFEAAWAQGTAMPQTRAVTFALRGRGQRRPRPAEGWASLTRAELDVVALAAEGLTNPRIAERLMLSRNTVKFHLSKSFAKLGVTSRVELAREVLRHSPVGT